MTSFAPVWALRFCLAVVAATSSKAAAYDASPAPAASPSAAPVATSAAPAAASSPAAASGEDAAVTRLATSLVAQVQSGKIDRSLFDAKTNAGLTQSMVDYVMQHMAPLGKPKSVTFETGATIDGYRSYHYRVDWGSVAVDESIALDSDGKIAGWYFQPST